MHTDLTLGRDAVRTRRAPGERLREVLLELAGHQASVLSHSEKSWASITFAGTRHRLKLTFEGQAAVQAGELFIAILPEHEFTIPGQLVADAAISAVDHRADPPRLEVDCELLLLQEA